MSPSTVVKTYQPVEPKHVPKRRSGADRRLSRASAVVHADCILFCAFSGLRINEALPLDWEAEDPKNGLFHVKREKRGINPWVPIMDEMQRLLSDMKRRSVSHLLFPSPKDPTRPIAHSTIAGTLRRLCRDLGLKHVTPHGLRSFFVTQCRESGLSDAEIAALIGDRSGPGIIAQTYGDVRPDHLIKQAKRVRLLARKAED